MADELDEVITRELGQFGELEPPDLWERIITLADTEHVEPRRARRRWPVLTAAALALTAIAIGVVVWVDNTSTSVETERDVRAGRGVHRRQHRAHRARRGAPRRHPDRGRRLGVVRDREPDAGHPHVRRAPVAPRHDRRRRRRVRCRRWTTARVPSRWRGSPSRTRSWAGSPRRAVRTGRGAGARRRSRGRLGRARRRPAAHRGQRSGPGPAHRTRTAPAGRRRPR